MKPFYPCLWFKENAAEAAAFYLSIFPNARIGSSNPMATILHIGEQRLLLLNGNTQSFNASVSFVIECTDQEMIDHYWYALSADGEEQACGWVKDKYGVSWQIVPEILGELMSHPARSSRVVQAFMKMKKFDIQALLDA